MVTVAGYDCRARSASFGTSWRITLAAFCVVQNGLSGACGRAGHRGSSGLVTAPTAPVKLLALCGGGGLAEQGFGVGCGSVRAGQMMLSCRASRVRSARRRQPALCRIRSRWERTVLTLMNRWPAIWASGTATASPS